MTYKPRYKPLHPEFPIEEYRRKAAIAVFRTALKNIKDEAAPFSFTSFGGIDAFAPALGWLALQQIWAAGPRDPLDANSVCDSCSGTLYVYGFAAQMTQAVVASVCLECKTMYPELMTREELVAEVKRWGFKDFKVGLGAGLQGAEVVLATGQPSMPNEARAQLFSTLLGDKKGSA